MDLENLKLEFTNEHLKVCVSLNIHVLYVFIFEYPIVLDWHCQKTIEGCEYQWNRVSYNYKF